MTTTQRKHHAPDPGGIASSRAADRPRIVDVLKRSIEEHTRLREQTDREDAVPPRHVDKKSYSLTR
jgi:hypothetical protein